jgi:hypothetical protein
MVDTAQPGSAALGGIVDRVDVSLEEFADLRVPQARLTQPVI